MLSKMRRIRVLLRDPDGRAARPHLRRPLPGQNDSLDATGQTASPSPYYPKAGSVSSGNVRAKACVAAMQLSGPPTCAGRGGGGAGTVGSRSVPPEAHDRPVNESDLRFGYLPEKQNQPD